jgi:hypothetical protein
VQQAPELYHRLILVVAPAGGGKTAALREVQNLTHATLVNVSLELSRRMLDMTRRQRALRLPRLFGELVDGAGGGLVLLDNLEVIFDIGLKQDPLQLLRRLSRNKTVVTAWSGVVIEDVLTYAVPGHPEYRRYSVRDIPTVSPGAHA